MEPPPIQYVTTSDGYHIAYTVAGEGPSLIFFPLDFTSVQTVWRYYPAWMQGLAERFRVISFDARGEGLSTRGLPEGTSVTDYVLDVQAVLEQFKEERFVLFVAGGRGHDAVRLALQNPDRVEALIWAVASVSNSAWPSGMWTTLPNENWKLFLSTLVPRSLSGEERNRRIQEYDDCIRLEDRNTWIRTHSRSDIKNELPRLKAPMLVLHPKDFFGLPVEESMKVTALAANAQFVSVDGEGIRSGDPARGLAATLAAIDSFLASLPPRDSHPTAPASSGAPPDAPSQREIEVLRLVAAGKSNRQIADELILSVRTVERHLSNAYAKLGARGRADAVAWLMRAPLWPSRRARRRRPSRPPPGQPSPCGR